MSVTLARLAYAEAYAVKGGGFRGVAKNMLTGQMGHGDVRDTMEAARNDAKAFVWAWAAERNMTTGSYRHNPNNWKMNYFIRSDEINA